MGISVLSAVAAAYTAIIDKANDANQPASFPIVVTLLLVYATAVAIGFWSHHQKSKSETIA